MPSKGPGPIRNGAGQVLPEEMQGEWEGTAEGWVPPLWEPGPLGDTHGGACPQRPSFDQHEAVVVLRAGVVADDLDGEAVAAGGGVDVNAGGFHGGSGLVWVEAVIEVAFVAEIARAGAEGEGLVVAGEEDLALEVSDDLLDGAPVPFAGAVDEERGLVAVEDSAGLLRRRGMGRASEVLAVAAAAVLAFEANPGGGDDGGG